MILLFVISSGCRKFTHEINRPGDCPLCDHADEVQGTYRGYATGLSLQFPPDSLTIVVKHIYLNKGPFVDSLTMFLEFTQKYDSLTDSTKVIYSFNNPEGTIKSDYQIFKIGNDQLRMYSSFYYPGSGMQTVSFDYTGYRLP